MKITTASVLIVICLVCAGPLAKIKAVSPPPDGGYGGNNTAEGTDALFSLSTGVWNSAFGFRALYRNTTSIRNTAVGYQALYNTNGSFNVSGQDNVAIAPNALFRNTTGSRNIAIGSFALHDNTDGSDNIAIGDHALWHFIGSGATVVGDSFASAPDSVSVGRLPTYDHGGNITSAGVLTANLNAQDDIYIGSGVFRTPTPTVTARVHILAQDAVYVGAVYGNAIAGSPVSIDSNGQLGVAASSKRFKTGIKPMENASETVLALKPVSFRYKKEIDPQCTPQFGLVAEEVEKVNADLVVRDKEGKPYSVRYDAVNAMLLNEFLKEHLTVQEQGTTIAQQQKEIKALKEELKEQASQIQKVSAQLQLSKPEPQTVLNNP
jgi:trimeric autotransporter adhesin